MSDECDVSDEEKAFLDADDEEMRAAMACPAWADGEHCYEPEEGNGRRLERPHYKRCACGKTVERAR